jgi:TRAP-type mannitol/chloroaromatic compound transport system permease small subunit
MRNKINTFFRYIEIASDKSGKFISLLVLVMMLIVVIGVILRYVFHVGFIWALPLNRQLFGVFILFGGAYAMLSNRHLRIEILYNRFSPRIKFYARLLNLLGFLALMGILIWQTGLIGISSVSVREVSQGTPKVPLYTIKALIPLISILFLLQGIASFFRKEEP